MLSNIEAYGHLKRPKYNSLASKHYSSNTFAKSSSNSYDSVSFSGNNQNLEEISKLRSNNAVILRKLMNSYNREASGERNNLVASLDIIGKKLSQSINKLSTEEKRHYIEQYVNTTQFPDLEKVSRAIENHAIDAIKEAAKELNIPVLYAGYDPTCSVAKNVALPGSDLDGMSILIKGSLKEREKLYVKILERLDPAIIDLDSLDHNRIITLNDVEIFGNYNFEEDELKKSKLRNLTGIMLEIIRDGEKLIDNLASERNWLKELPLYKTNHHFHKEEFIEKEKDKHKARSVLKKFNRLSLDGQFSLIRILQHQYEGIPLNLKLDNNNPNYDGFLDLLSNNFAIVYKDSLSTTGWLNGIPIMQKIRYYNSFLQSGLLPKMGAI